MREGWTQKGERERGPNKVASLKRPGRERERERGYKRGHVIREAWREGEKVMEGEKERGGFQQGGKVELVIRDVEKVSEGEKEEKDKKMMECWRKDKHFFVS